MDLFTEDRLYVEHMYGTMRGREAVRAWIVPIMEEYEAACREFDPDHPKSTPVSTGAGARHGRRVAGRTPTGRGCGEVMA